MDSRLLKIKIRLAKNYSGVYNSPAKTSRRSGFGLDPGCLLDL
jgi:hypothetical protein